MVILCTQVASAEFQEHCGKLEKQTFGYQGDVVYI